MIGMILIILILAVLAVIFSKIFGIGSKLTLVFLIIFIVFIIGSVAYVFLETKPDVSTFDGFSELGKSYFVWIGSLFNNIEHVTNYAVKQDWSINKTLERGER